MSYGISALARRGVVDSGRGVVSLPVFGLYPGYANQVSIELTFADASKETLVVEVSTEPYVDPNGIYDRPNILKARELGSSLGFDYIALKNMLGGPVIIDTDGAVRWVGPAIANSTSTAFFDNAFEIGSQDSTVLTRIELDGTVGQVTLDATDYLNFHHNIDAGASANREQAAETAPLRCRCSTWSFVSPADNRPHRNAPDAACQVNAEWPIRPPRSLVAAIPGDAVAIHRRTNDQDASGARQRRRVQRPVFALAGERIARSRIRCRRGPTP